MSDAVELVGRDAGAGRLAGGLQAATRELGSALGVAVVGSVLSTVLLMRLPSGVRAHAPAAHTIAQVVAAVPDARAAATTAFLDGASTALVAAAIVTLVLGTAVTVLSAANGERRRRREDT